MEEFYPPGDLCAGKSILDYPSHSRAELPAQSQHQLPAEYMTVFFFLVVYSYHLSTLKGSVFLRI